MLYPAPRFTCRSPRPTSDLTGGGGPRCSRRPRPGRDHSRHTEGPSCAHCRSPNAQRTVLRTGPRPSLRFGARTGRFRGPGHHPLMVSHHHRTDVSAGKESSRHSEPTVALRASVRRHRSSLGAVIVRESMVTSRQDRIEPRGYFPDASVDPTEARNTIRQDGCDSHPARYAARPRPACNRWPRPDHPQTHARPRRAARSAHDLRLKTSASSALKSSRPRRGAKSGPLSR